MPPASASIPTDERAAAYPMIWSCDSPTCVPAAAIRIPMLTMSASVVAMLLPRATTELPSSSNLSWLIPVIFANCANMDAPSSLVRFVASARFAIVSVNSAIFSVCIPNCPADSAMAESSAADAGISFDISRISSRSSSSCALLAFTVFSTPANADSNSIPVLIDAPSPAAIPAPAATAAAEIAAKEAFATDSKPEKAGSASSNPFFRLSPMEGPDFPEVAASTAITDRVASFARSLNSFFVSLVLS